MPRKPKRSVAAASNPVKAGHPQPVMTDQIIHANKKKKQPYKRMAAVRRSTRLVSAIAPSPSGGNDTVEEPISLSESENEEEQYDCPDKTSKSPAPDHLEEGVNHMDNETILEEDANHIGNETVLEGNVDHMDNETVLEDINHFDDETILEEDVNHIGNETVLEGIVGHMDNETVLEDINHLDNETVFEDVNHMDNETANELFKSKGIKISYPDENPNANMSYKSLYIDALKKVEALKEENAALAKKLDFSRGKIEAYESMKDTLMHLKDIVLVAGVGRATEAAINMVSQGTLGKAPNGAA